jgi:SAM-dependent methyltransferase
MADHPLFAAAYDHAMAFSEARGLAERRHRLLSQAEGRVLEIGAGTGLNLAHYPPGAVTSVVALEPDGAMRRRLQARIDAGGSPVPCRVEGAEVGRAGYPAGSFDTVVCTFVLCTVPDPQATVAAIGRWLAPEGRLLFLEHVHGTGLTARLQWAAGPLWRRVAAGCHLDRDTLSVLRGADLIIGECERFAWPAGGPLLTSCVQGVARPRSVVAALAGGRTESAGRGTGGEVVAGRRPGAAVPGE